MKPSRNKESQCEQCGEIFTSRPTHLGRTRFCSHKCAGLARYVKRVKRHCVGCGTTFLVRPSEAHKLSCGASDCLADVRTKAAKKRPQSQPLSPSQRRAKRKEREKKERASGRPCARPGCRNKTRERTAKYCSPACHYADRKRMNRRRGAWYKHICETCGKEFERAKGRGTGRWCSNKCRTSIYKAASAPIPEAVPPPSDRVLRRAWNEGTLSCVICGRSPAHRHHVIYEQHVAREGGARWDVRNRMGLCPEHHYGHHFGRQQIQATLIPDSAYEFAVDLFGRHRAYNYLCRHYIGNDPRLAALIAN